jgi:hypothetical protein
MLFVLSVLLFALREAFKLQPVKRESALLVHIRPYFMYFIFRSRATFILEESSETILLFVDSGGSEVGHVPLDVGTIERRCGVTVLVKPLPESSF